MTKLNKYLYDNLDREYERKNLYLYELSTLQESGVENKEKVKDFIKDKSNHRYNKEFNEYKKQEKSFLDNLKVKSSKINESNDLPKKAQKLEKRLYEAKEKVSFYKKYVKLTYDAELIYEQSKMEISQIPAVIKFAREAKKELDSAIAKKSTISTSTTEAFQKEFKEFKDKERVKLKEYKESIKAKYKEGLISGKARENSIKEANRKFKEIVLLKSFEDEKINNKEIIKNKNFELRKTLSQKINAININVDDLRRVYPIEEDKTIPWVSYATMLIPGLSQLFNKQYVKSIIMFIATIYIYAIAIPYALGYGNYRGDGVAGLITLAQDGSRLDRSIIFMIEGIIALVLIGIAVVLLIISFKDSSKVEKDRIKGVRVRSWCETRQTFIEDGFPYIISIPALILTLFIVIVPVTTAILLSFTGMGPDTQSKFGWEALTNYKMIIMGEGMAGEVFWKILAWTIIWTICATTLAVALGFILAIVLNNDRIKGKTLFRSIYLLPWAVPAFISILFFSILSSPDGSLTALAQSVFGENIQLKNDPTISRVVLICMQAWLGSAYVFLLSTGVLQSINKDLYEAADIDGATSFKKLTKITVPLVLFQTAPLLVGQYTFNFNNFTIIYLFNGGGPFNPVEYGNLAGSTDLLISYIYKLTMENQYQAVGAAISIMISIALMIMAYIGFKNTAAFREE